MIGLAMIATALLLHWRARRALRSVGIHPGTFDAVRRPTQYLATGVFRLRHPLYVSYLLFIGGVGALAFGPAGVALALPAAPFYAQRIAEEGRLRREWTIG